MKTSWVTFFSQTGSEIVDLAKTLGRWPDLIITNERPAGLRTIHPELKESNLLVTVSNRPTVSELEQVIGYYKDPIITLHGWLRIMPASICEKYKIFNGHPGLITEYDFLKGKDPQIKAIEKHLPTMGCVIHKVTPGVDEGPVIKEGRFSPLSKTESEIWAAFKETSLNLWISFLDNYL